MTEQHDSVATSAPRIVVGVGPEEVGSALAYAATEAVRIGCGIHLVHAVHVAGGGPEMAALLVDVEQWGRAVLVAAVARTEELVGGAVPVTSALVHGSPVAVLVEAGGSARLVVLEHRHLSRLSRVVNRTVAGGVAAHLRVPVVAVPSGWSTHTRDRGVVVAGVDEPARSEEVLRAAVDEAQARGATLRAVHAWPLSGAYEDLVAEWEEPERWEARARAEVRAALDALDQGSVAAEAEVVVRAGRAAETLLLEAKDADLLVIGRHDPLVPIGSHIGPVARAVLREATCPVLLASPRLSARAATR